MAGYLGAAGAEGGPTSWIVLVAFLSPGVVQVGAGRKDACAGPSVAGVSQRNSARLANHVNPDTGRASHRHGGRMTVPNTRDILNVAPHKVPEFIPLAGRRPHPEAGLGQAIEPGNCWTATAMRATWPPQRLSHLGFMDQVAR